MNKRRESRLEGSVVHIHECHDDPDLVGEFIACEVIDYSCHGMRLSTRHALVPNTLLYFTINFGDDDSSYRLGGEILWTEIIDNDCHLGVLFSGESSSDLDAWITSVNWRENSVLESNGIA